MLLQRMIHASWLVLAGLLLATPGRAQVVCLSSDEMREAIVEGHAVSAVVATRTARDATSGDILRVRLCREQEKLTYRVTLLQRDGRVGHVTINGSSGKIEDVR